MPSASVIDPAPVDSTTGKKRSAAIDHIRIVLTMLVVLHHTAIEYGGSGGWYWRQEPNASSVPLILFNATNQAFFMGFFFLLAGYYTPASFERKGAGPYLKDRLIRLGVPLLVFFFLLQPFTIALARTSEGHPLWDGWLEMIRAGEFGPGPLWFAEALLIFGAGYALWRRLRPQRSGASAIPGFGTLLGVALGLGVTSFLVRLAIPVGEEVLWMQLGYFPCYVFLFAAGCAASEHRLLEHVTFRQARPWLVVSLVTLVTLPVVFLTRSGQGAFEGGMNANAFFYALWDPLLAWGVILGMLWAAHRYASEARPLTGWLSRNAYAAYIVHPPVVVAISLAAVGMGLAPLATFALVGLSACAGSFLVAALVRLLPGARGLL